MHRNAFVMEQNYLPAKQAQLQKCQIAKYRCKLYLKRLKLVTLIFDKRQPLQARRQARQDHRGGKPARQAKGQPLEGRELRQMLQRALPHRHIGRQQHVVQLRQGFARHKQPVLHTI